VRRNDLGLPFLNGVYTWEGTLSDSKSFTYILQGGKNILADTELVKIWFYGSDDIVDNGAIYGGLKGSIRVTIPSSTWHGYVL
jgi:hypothetical protein